ncbi:zinc finger BED domain-containing protein RICESLEEPER 1-like [Rutidosis leptorrhynchoides]|uniref:zinc finger BED domain-containing protein RICESLEEPER 1-like n=1 Tax=Rutidosis leptorrhynchoides TaxID=125765 RepID=UPI003A996188
MKAKYDKYWDDMDSMNVLLYVALVLDPRNKLFFLDYCLGLIYGTNTKKISDITKQVTDTLDALFNQYKEKMEKEKGKDTIISSSSTPGVGMGTIDLDIDDGYEKYLKNCGVGVNDIECQIYLRDATEKKIKGDDTYDVLGWWKLNSVKYPILSQVARHVLAMPVSTVASESAFSTGGRVIDKFRSSLTPKTSEALICTQDWLRSTPADLQEMGVNGIQLKDLNESLAKLEIDIIPNGKTPMKDTCIDDSWLDED